MAKLEVVDTARARYLWADLSNGVRFGEVSRVIGHNTKLVRNNDGSVAIRLYSTDVVTVYPDNSVRLDTGGYVTVTTVERINHIVKRLGYVAYRSKGMAYIQPLANRAVSYSLQGFTITSRALDVVGA